MCKYHKLCKELYPEDEERRSACNEDNCDRYDAFFEGECISLEASWECEGELE